MVHRYSASDSRYNVESCSRVPTDMRCVEPHRTGSHDPFGPEFRGEPDVFVAPLGHASKRPRIAGSQRSGRGLACAASARFICSSSKNHAS